MCFAKSTAAGQRPFCHMVLFDRLLGETGAKDSSLIDTGPFRRILSWILALRLKILLLTATYLPAPSESPAS